MTTKPGEPLHIQHLDRLKRCMEIAHAVGSPNVRILSPKKSKSSLGLMALKSGMLPRVHGMPYSQSLRQHWKLLKMQASNSLWKRANGTMVNSSWTARKLIDDLDAKETLKVLWDPANNCWCHETAYPDGYELLREGYIAHIHIKDVYADTPRAYLEVREMGKGQLADQFKPMAEALHRDNYEV